MFDLRHSNGLFFHGDEMLIRRESNEFIISLEAIFSDGVLNFPDHINYFLGKVNRKNLYTIEISKNIIEKNDQFYFLPIRRFLETLDSELFHQVCTAKQLLNWHKDSLFCGSCGALNELSTTETAKICSDCRRISYPHYSPAIIVLIERENEILLGRSPHFSAGMYSPLAGFIEASENAEDAVVREVHEEVGLEIKNIQYFGSQNWPFPHSFMLGYTATYASGEICINYDELEDACWFSIDKLPLLPSKASISRHLIDAFVERAVLPHQKT